MSQRYAFFNDTQLPIGENDTVAEVKQAMSKFFPAVLNYQANVDEDGNIKFVPQGGSKGAGQRYAFFNDTKLPIGENDTVAEVKQAMSKFFPAVLNYQANVDEDGNIKFVPQGGSKGN